MASERVITEAHDEGVSIVLVALMLTFLLGMAAFGVDIALANSEATRLQRAADAAALSGVVFIPSGLADAAAAATETAAANGYPASQVTVEPIVNRSDRVRVTIRQNVPLNFGQFLGTDSIDLERHAVAEYNGPIPMGSPANGLGNEPILTCDPALYPTPAELTACNARRESSWVNSAGQGQFWMHVAGPARPKSNGDAFQSCDGTAPACGDDYRPEGYVYLVRNSQSGRIDFQAFDPAFIRVGDRCDEMPADLGANLRAVVPDAPTRYAFGPTSPYCTGDADAGANPITTFIVRAPDSTPWNSLDNPVVCQQQFGSFNDPGGLQARLDPTNAAYTTRLLAGRPWTVANTFRKWVDYCSVANPVSGDYVVQIVTNRPASADPASVSPASFTYDQSGGNRFSIRVGRGNGVGFNRSASADGISIFAAGRLGIYTNATAAQTQFYLARVPSSARGKELTLRFYDTGDSPTEGELTIIGPSGTPMTGCVYQGPAVNNPDRLASECTADGLLSSEGFNGAWMTMRVRLPNNYSCNDGDAASCWFRVRFAYPSQVPNDTTSWSASLGGDPVRLIE
jgi:hypothetical protein